MDQSEAGPGEKTVDEKDSKDDKQDPKFQNGSTAHNVARSQPKNLNNQSCLFSSWNRFSYKAIVPFAPSWKGM